GTCTRHPRPGSAIPSPVRATPGWSGGTAPGTRTTRPTASPSASSTSSWPAAATTGTSRPTSACTPGRVAPTSRSRWTSPASPDEESEVLGDRLQVDDEHQHTVGRDAHLRLRAIPEGGRDHDLAAAADLHARDALGEAGDHAGQREGDGGPAGPRGVEDPTVG